MSGHDRPAFPIPGPLDELSEGASLWDLVSMMCIAAGVANLPSTITRTDTDELVNAARRAANELLRSYEPSQDRTDGAFPGTSQTRRDRGASIWVLTAAMTVQAGFPRVLAVPRGAQRTAATQALVLAAREAADEFIVRRREPIGTNT